MKMSEQFAGNYLKATDLPQPRLLTIQTVLTARMSEGDTKPALAFFEEKRQLVLNKTNAFQLAEWFGDDAAGWSGRQVELYSTQTNYSGRLVPCIRVRLPMQQLPPQWQQPVAVPQPVPSPPPQWQQPAAVQQQPPPQWQQPAVVQQQPAAVQQQQPPPQWQQPVVVQQQPAAVQQQQPPPQWQQPVVVQQQPAAVQQQPAAVHQQQALIQAPLFDECPVEP